MTSTMNQKEYLKKYLGIGKAPGEKKKKKKKEKAVGNRLKIIDDDVDVLMSQEIEDDLAAANEDAPQIVAVIDERPISLQVDEKTHSSLWTPLGEPSTKSETNILKVNSFKVKQAKSSDGQKSTFKIKKESATEVYRKHTSSSATVTRIKQESDDWGRNGREKSRSPVRKNKTGHISSPEQGTSSNTPLRRQDVDDASPPRRKYKEERSPPRKQEENTDYSPPRRNRESDNSPPRRRRSRDVDSSPARKNDQDISPPRRRPKSEDNSPPRRKHKDSSPPRKKQRENSSSPKRRSKIEKKQTTSEELGTSPTRKRRREGRKSRWSPEKSPQPEKITKTLDGKRAGLQNAIDLFVESKRLREKEDEMFSKMSTEVSGRDAATVIRAKKVKDLEEEAAKARREKEMKEKYDLWGKGLKQVEDQNVRIEEQLREMSKPLARYADDEDLEKFLKEQERDGDPMLAYIRKKKKKEKVEAGIPEKPTYMGEFMPNRFGIPPGYRWDGVDRSNGYEKKWFQVQNEKRATREEAFKWLSEDM